MSTGRVLVTGGAGYIGSVLVPFLIENGYKVTILDSKGNDPLARMARFVKMDIRDIKKNNICFKDVESIIYLAGVSDGRAGRKNPQLTHQVNVEAFKHFVNLAKENKCRRFIFASTFGVYGNKYNIPLIEKLKPYPAEPYSYSKLLAEEYLAGQFYPDFVTVSLRLAMVFGWAPYFRDEFIVNRLTLDAIEQGRVEILGGDQRRPQIHIKDVARLFKEMLKADENLINGKVFNAGSFNPSLNQIAFEIENNLDTKPDIEIKPSRAGENSFELDSSCLKKIIDFQPKFSLKDGIVEIAQKYLSVKHKKTEYSMIV